MFQFHNARARYWVLTKRSTVFESEAEKARELESATNKALGNVEITEIHEVHEAPNKQAQVPEKIG